MANEPASKPPFWTSLPGILTALGGVVVALTGLISALYSSGAIGARSNVTANSNIVVQSNSPGPVALAAPKEAAEDYKGLTGKWEVIESPSQYYDKVEQVTWRYEATISGNVLTLKGKLVALDGDKNLPDDGDDLSATCVTTLVGSGGIGEYKLKQPDGSALTSEATIRFDDDMSHFHAKFENSGYSYTLAGRKL